VLSPAGESQYCPRDLELIVPALSKEDSPLIDPFPLRSALTSVDEHLVFQHAGSVGEAAHRRPARRLELLPRPGLHAEAPHVVVVGTVPAAKAVAHTTEEERLDDRAKRNGVGGPVSQVEEPYTQVP
jgi:hypothetical protein